MGFPLIYRVKKKGHRGCRPRPVSERGFGEGNKGPLIPANCENHAGFYAGQRMNVDEVRVLQLGLFRGARASGSFSSYIEALFMACQSGLTAIMASFSRTSPGGSI